MNDQTPPNISPELQTYIESITAKRAKTVLDHILKYGYITTEELKRTYGYDHAPRAARDVREQGIDLETFKVTGSNGRKIAAYRFPSTVTIEIGKSGGRRAFPKKFKQALLVRDNERCSLCGGKFTGNVLQVDHKVPYEVGGDKEGDLNPEEFILLCPSCNRAKSWECEHCDNWKSIKDISICNTCMFGSPNSYKHIALRQVRRLTITWDGKEVQDYDSLETEANEAGENMSEYVKNTLKARILNDEK